MNMKKIAVLALSLCMVAAIAVTGTIAYFQDTDYNKNVMVLGNVTIDQYEYEIKDDGSFGEYKDNKDLFPAVYDELKTTTKDLNGHETKVWTDVKNVIDKFVQVQNTGTEAAYIRTVFAFEVGKNYKEGTDELNNLHDTYFGVNGSFDYLDEYVQLEENGPFYILAVEVYEDPIASQAFTPTSLRQLFLSPDANNEVIDLFGSEYDIHVVSQAVQAEGFTSGAEAALNKAFGEVNATNAKTWFTTTNSKLNSQDGVKDI